MQSGSGFGGPLIDALSDWLIDQAIGEPQFESLFEGCCQRLTAAGIPVTRAMLGFRVLHPLHRAVTYTWVHDQGLSLERHGHTSIETDAYLTSPVHHMVENRVPYLRRHLAGEEVVLDFPVLADLRDRGLTDYLGYLVEFRDTGEDIGPDAGIVGSWCTDRENGFTDSEIQVLLRIQRQLAVPVKVRVKDQVAQNVLATYLGPDAGGRVLSGTIQRGEGENIRSAIWYSDMRDSTPLADSLGSEAFLSMLNEYFEYTAGAILNNGGEVLRFVGDAVLGIFPISRKGQERRACARALAAAREALARRDEKLTNNDPANVPRFGIGLHLGEVLYGNIGVPSRLEFSVIGPAANEVARIEEMTKEFKTPVIVSGELARHSDDLVPLRKQSARGVSRKLDLYTLKELKASAVR